MEKMEPNSRSHIPKRLSETQTTHNKSTKNDADPCAKVARSRLPVSLPRHPDADHSFSLRPIGEDVQFDIASHMEIHTHRYSNLHGRVRTSH